MEVKKIVIWIAVFFLNCSCNNKQEDQIRVDLGNGIFYNLIYSGDSVYRISWGNKVFKNQSLKSFEILGSGTPNYSTHNSKVIFLKQSCGTSCSYGIVLPLVKGAQEKEYIFVLEINTQENLIAYIPDSKDAFIRVENYLTGKYFDVVESNLCPAVFKGDCIEKIEIRKKKIVLHWQGSKWTSNKSDLQTKEIEINL